MTLWNWRRWSEIWDFKCIDLKLTILGYHSATPRANANPSSQILEIRNHLFLIDCGEGTQVQLRKFKISFSKIKHIFISHLHGDHVFGLIGLISTFRLLGRTSDLTIHGPKGIKELIEVQLKLSQSKIDYQLIFNELTGDKSQIVFEDNTVKVASIPLNHRIYTNGFLFSEKPSERRLNAPAAREAQIDKAYFSKLKQGFDVINEVGQLVTNEEVTFDPPKTKSYAYCSDTAYHPTIVPLIHGVDCLYHESTFLNEDEELADKTLHSTARQAAEIAKLANVSQLILGHFSSRYDEENHFLLEAKDVFGMTFLAENGKEFVW